MKSGWEDNCYLLLLCFVDCRGAVACVRDSQTIDQTSIPVMVITEVGTVPQIAT